MHVLRLMNEFPFNTHTRGGELRLHIMRREFLTLLNSILKIESEREREHIQVSPVQQ